MKKRFVGKNLVVISSMLFGMFFGAGNLIFPANMGVAAGKNMLFAYLGMFITAVGLPLLSVAALGISRSDSVLDVAQKPGRGFGVFFSTLLYLTIGPLFAVPRCAGTSFSVGAVLLGEQVNQSAALAVFSLLFFAAVMAFSLRPGRIMVWIGKILNPLFLVLLFVLIFAALANPMQPLSSAVPHEDYLTPGKAFFEGFLDGYNTLDALAGLAFGIVVVNAVRQTGITEPSRIAGATVCSGVFSCLSMGAVYLLIALISAQSASLCGDCSNGSEVLGVIAGQYFGKGGTVLLFAIVTMACLKTAVGLVTSCAEAFVKMFPNGLGYKPLSVLFVVVSMLIANFGLTTIVNYCVPVLMFIYPLAIVLIFLSLSGRFFRDSKIVCVTMVVPTFVAAFMDFLRELCPLLGKGNALQEVLTTFVSSVGNYIPLFQLGLGWLLPAAVGFFAGLILNWCKMRTNK